MIQSGIPEKTLEALLFALESARTQLSVAIALETKTTPRDRRQYYLETADQMRVFAKKLRTAHAESLPGGQQWVKAIDILGNLPPHGRALSLCQILRDVAIQLEEQLRPAECRLNFVSN